MRKLFSFILIVTLIISMNAGTAFAADVTDSDMQNIKNAMNIIKEYYKDDVPNKQLVDSAIKGMLGSLDPHSSYFTKDEYDRFISSLDGSFSGIGVNVKKNDKYIEVIGIIKNSPAEKVGLAVGDKFYSVDGVSMVGGETEVFVSKVRGPKGTKVKLGVLRGSSTQPIYFDIIRDNIEISPVEYKVLDNGIGYLAISEFGTTAYEGVLEALSSFDKKNVKNIIIDLRGNPGGYLDQAVSIGRLFVPKGPIVKESVRGKVIKVYSSYLEKPKYKLAVLIDGGSASASEILAGAIQDTGVGKLVGTKSYGKGTVQTFIPLNRGLLGKNGPQIKLTIARYLTPKDRTVDGVGLMSDYEVKNGTALNEDMFEPITYFRNLVPGNRGKDVLPIEQRLDALGYTVGGPDYKYDETTKQGLAQFEKDYKMPVGSTITKATIDVITKALEDSVKKDLQFEKAVEILRN